jgi:formylglycine-generating enzyme required for sulfatase activity
MAFFCLVCLFFTFGVAAEAAVVPGTAYTNSLGMEFVLIPSGSFMMGSKHRLAEDHEQPVHKVNISRFFLGKYEVTQAQWKAVMGERNNFSQFKRDKNPVDSVSWEDAQEFIKRLNKSEGTNIYRLPTEAEWEYAARAGSTGEFFFGNDGSALAQYAWYGDNSDQHTHAVGLKKPNPWGLYDIYGNVMEWVQDWGAVYPAKESTDPGGPSSGPGRIARGCDWYSRGLGPRAPVSCRSAYREWFPPGNIKEILGFRLAISIQ